MNFVPFAKGYRGNTVILLRLSLLYYTTTNDAPKMSYGQGYIGSKNVCIPQNHNRLLRCYGNVITKDHLSKGEQKLFEEYLESVRALDDDYQKQYEKYVEELSSQMVLFMGILDRAFVIDIRMAFNGSVDLARKMGVPAEEILDTEEKRNSYFLS